MRNMFKRHTHEEDDTLGSGSCLLLLKVRTEGERKTVAFQNALNVNGLPVDPRTSLILLDLSES